MTKPIIAVVGQPDWLAQIAPQLDDEFTLQPYEAGAGYVSWLADQLVVLILVDGTEAQWREYTATPKSNPATRRIPIFVVAPPDQHEAGLLAGADLVLTPDELVQEAANLARAYARVMDAEAMALLDCQCQEPLPPQAVEGMAKFNAGEYYRQHDLFEALWMQIEGPVRDLYRAILQVGVAYYQIERGNHRGALKMLLRSVQWLALLPDVCQGVDVKRLKEDSYRVRAALEALDPADIDHFDHSLLKPVRMAE
ncbi:MAG: DUF309 domain-containing protein [Anaerolineae bacterium]|nr:DUF309 domain-containing protein [Anaerolineae bacterium]